MHDTRVWFDRYLEDARAGLKDPPPHGILYTCPCCGYPMLTERDGYEICHLCFWEDDGQDDPHADERWGGPNGRYTLTEARQNFLKYWNMFSPDDHHFQPPMGELLRSSPAELEAKRSIVQAFNQMPTSPPEGIQALWEMVEHGLNALQAESNRKHSEFALKHKQDAHGKQDE